MKKFVFVLAFAAVATISFAAINSVKANPVVIENFDEKPKKTEKKAEAKEADKKADKKECTKTTTTKSDCSSAKKSSCCKKTKDD